MPFIFSMIIHSPIFQRYVPYSWKLTISQFFHGLHTHQMSPIEHVWDALDLCVRQRVPVPTRQLCALNMSILRTNTSSGEVDLSSILSQERLTCILLMVSLCVCPRASYAALFLCPSLWHLITQLNSSPGATKLEPVGPALLIVLLRR